MAVRRSQPFVGMLCMPFLLGACAGSSPERTAETPASAEPRTGTAADAPPVPVRFDFDSDLPFFTDPKGRGPLVASRVNASVDQDRLRYQAGWAVTTGELPAQHDAASTFPGSQQLEQDIRLKLAALAGAPVALGLSTQWKHTLGDPDRRPVQREQATLSWAPGPAAMAVEAGTATPFAAGTALACDLRSTIRLPGRSRSGGLKLSGAACSVAAGETSFAGMEARAFAFAYAWDRSHRSIEAALSVIDAAEEAGDYRGLPPGVEFSVSHRRDLGPFRAESRVSLQEAPTWEPEAGAYVLDLDPALSARTAISWNLPRASLSANWANGMDRLWFTPGPASPSDRFGLGVDLSRWLGTVVPRADPEFAMNWNWSQVRPPGDAATIDHAFRLDLTLYF